MADRVFSASSRMGCSMRPLSKDLGLDSWICSPRPNSRVESKQSPKTCSDESTHFVPMRKRQHVDSSIPGSKRTNLVSLWDDHVHFSRSRVTRFEDLHHNIDGLELLWWLSVQFSPRQSPPIDFRVFGHEEFSFFCQKRINRRSWSLLLCATLMPSFIPREPSTIRGRRKRLWEKLYPGVLGYGGACTKKVCAFG